MWGKELLSWAVSAFSSAHEVLHVAVLLQAAGHELARPAIPMDSVSSTPSAEGWSVQNVAWVLFHRHFHRNRLASPKKNVLVTFYFLYFLQTCLSYPTLPTPKQIIDINTYCCVFCSVWVLNSEDVLWLFNIFPTSGGEKKLVIFGGKRNF